MRGFITAASLALASINKDNKSASVTIIVDRDACIAVTGDWLVGGRVEGAYISALDTIDYFLLQY